RVGLREARGEFVAFIDGDDWVRKDYLSALIEEQAANDCDVVICGQYKQAFNHAAITRTTVAPQ
ncbi:MAG: glycosyltransferase, partial [Muribaculaceae bacterium]|nr:glycosyltransferase [Muribaculaceae bacterium]